MTSGFIKRKYNVMYFISLLGWIVCIFGDFVDAILAGIYISEDAVSATGLVLPIYGIIVAIAMSFGVGFGNVYSYYIGEFDIRKSRITASMGIITGLIVGVLSLIFFIGTKGIFFDFFDVGQEIESLASEYYDKLALVTLIYPIYCAIYYLVLEDGGIIVSFLADMVSVLFNPIVSVMLVGRFGIGGLAYGTIITQLMGILVLFIHFISKRNSIRLMFGFDLHILKEAVKCGSAVLLTGMYMAIIDVIMNKFIIVDIGEVFLPAYTIVNLILNLGEIFASSIDAAGPFVSVGYGEKNPSIIKKVMRLSVKYNIVLSVVMLIIFIVIAGNIPDIYGIETPEIRDASIYTVRVLAFTFIADSIIVIWVSYFPRVGKAFLGNLVGFLYMFLLPLCCVIPLGLMFGYNGLVLGFFLTSVLTVIIVVIVIAVKYGWKSVPFIISESNADIYMHELKLCPEEIVELNRVVDEELKQSGVEDNIINKVELMIEESFNVIVNENSKNVLAECTVMVEDNRVSLITRDNGKIFDITKVDDRISSIGHYVASRLINDNDETINLTSISFNRNCYRWDRS